MKYLAYGSNSEFTDSENETYTLLMKKPYFDKIIGRNTTYQAYSLKRKEHKAPNIF